MTETMLPATTQSTEEKRGLALLKAVGLDRVSAEQRELALAIADRYELDLMLKHLVLIEGRAYITRDGLLHVAHRSGLFDGIEVTAPVKVDAYWRSTCSVFRKDMSRPFTYHGRYPATGGNAKYNEEMAVKVAEVAALRRAFDVSAPTVEEQWEGVTLPAAEPAPKRSLAELARVKADALKADDEPTTGDGAEEATFRADEAPTTPDAAPEPSTGLCGSESDKALGEVETCALEVGHLTAGPRRHQSAGGTVWPAAKDD